MLRLDINIVWTILNLLIIFAIVKIFLIKPIHKILDARQAEIDKQYADAKAAQDSAEELKTKYEASLSGVQDLFCFGLGICHDTVILVAGLASCLVQDAFLFCLDRSKKDPGQCR